MLLTIQRIRDRLVRHLNHITFLENLRVEAEIGTDGYKNLTSSIFHYEGRIAENRAILSMIESKREVW